MTQTFRSHYTRHPHTHRHVGVGDKGDGRDKWRKMNSFEEKELDTVRIIFQIT